MSPRSLGRLLLATRALPPRPALFQVRAMLRARRLGDDWALESSTRPGDVAELLRLARGRRAVVELGTATGWTAGALLLADPLRRLTSFDPVVREWQPRLAPGALVVLHDYGNPAYAGVAEAVEELGLDGRPRAGLWLWRAS